MKRSEIKPMGYLATNTIFCNDETPALVVNKQAKPIDLLAWCAGELMSMEATANTLVEVSGKDASMALADFSAIFMHRLEPVVQVLGAALEELVIARQQEIAA